MRQAVHRFKGKNWKKIGKNSLIKLFVNSMMMIFVHETRVPIPGIYFVYAAECFKDRTDVQCLHRWQKVLNPDLVKGPWSKEVRTRYHLHSHNNLLITNL